MATSPSPLSLKFLNKSPLKFQFITFQSQTLTRISCSHQTVKLDNPQPTKKKRKPRPSFSDQVLQKWSAKITPSLEKFPWEVQKEEKGENPAGVEAKEGEEIGKDSSVSFSSWNRIKLAPWVEDVKKPGVPSFDSGFIIAQIGEIVDFDGNVGGNVARNDESEIRVLERKWVSEEVKVSGKERGYEENVQRKFVRNDESEIRFLERKWVSEEVSISGKEKGYEENVQRKSVGNDESEIGFLEKKEDSIWVRENGQREVVNEMQGGLIEEEGDSDSVLGNFSSSIEEENSRKLPWEKESSVKAGERDVWKRSNTHLAEKLIPDFELKRLRNEGKRMVEIIKVGAAGITQLLVDSIHERWKVDEVVKLRFEGASSMNMKRNHETLENRTGGLVIWRSGSLVVLFRGMSYKLPCVQLFTKQSEVDVLESQSSKCLENELPQRAKPSEATTSSESSISYSGRYVKDLSEEELKDLSELNLLLDELGPRFKDWSGRDPLPVDADLLPPVVPGYRRPFRLLPYGIRPGLRDKEMTVFRRTARFMPPHFALGRNRELQGLAAAMVKLWEKSAIAKIAIKRGVYNTNNERMAEELKILTGGTLVSRNKDYIVFYRGNDFLPPGVTKTLDQAKELTTMWQEEEDQARQRASMLVTSNSSAAKGPLVAGTLNETLAATSRWANQPSSEERDKMMRDLALARHASLVKFLENKLAVARGKVKKAEKALRKVQDYLKPADLPTDSETLTDEERFLFRKIGLSMKPFLVLGRRGVFDGTIENMHLHWKFRELVKIFVERKNLAQVKHVAISLEAESGGVLVSVDKTTKGYAVIVYRGKNYQRPQAMRPKNLLSRRQALARSVELQRREALKHHISELQERIEKLKLELDDMKTVKEIDEETLRSRVSADPDDNNDDETDEDEDEEAYLEIYDDSKDQTTDA